MHSQLSVIIPAYNARKVIRRCIESIQKQSFRDIEMIVVDDGSTDDTESVVKSLAIEDPCILKEQNS